MRDLEFLTDHVTFKLRYIQVYYLKTNMVYKLIIKIFYFMKPWSITSRLLDGCTVNTAGRRQTLSWSSAKIGNWDDRLFHQRFSALWGPHVKSWHVQKEERQWVEIRDLTIIKTGYLKRSQCCELAILRPFLAIFPQTTLRTFTKVNFWQTFWGAKHI